MIACMQQALGDSGVKAEEIDYINAHATATLQGDQEEAEAIRDIFGDLVPVKSIKGHIGHTLGAAGAIELAATLEMMRRNLIYPTRSLEIVSHDWEGIQHVMQPLKKQLNTILKNGFAFGGINAALVCRKV